ncbi:MAG: hypothetical protein ACYCT2_04225 [Thermoplasmataceae archaeon]
MIWDFHAAESPFNVHYAQKNLDSAFINRYVNNVNSIHVNSENLTQQNTTTLFLGILFSGENPYNLVQNALNSEPVMNSPVVVTINVFDDPWVWQAYTPTHIDTLGKVSMWKEKFVSFMEFKTNTDAQTFKNTLAQELIYV